MGFIKRIIPKYDLLNIYMDISTINIRRIYLLSIVMGLINIVHIVVFNANIPSDSKRVIQWYYLIIIIHSIMLLINSIIGLISFWIEKRKHQGKRLSFFIQIVSIVVNLLFGILLCVSDQLIMTDINPLLTAYIGVGVIFLIPPLVTFSIYFVTLALFFYIVTWTQPVPDLLQHVRVNSVTAAGIGFGISWILWNNHILKARQQKIIEEQKKQLEEKNEYLQYVAKHDPLTGLLTRSYFTDIVNKEILNNIRSNKEACIVLMDIDSFKQINDNFGHPMGDKVIKDIAKIIMNTIRPADFCARLGGDEMIILLLDTNLQTGSEMAEKIRNKIKDYYFQYKGHSLRVTASFGIARLKDSFERCYNQADEALYASKKNGRNCVEVCDDSFVISSN